MSRWTSLGNNQPQLAAIAALGYSHMDSVIAIGLLSLIKIQEQMDGVEIHNTQRDSASLILRVLLLVITPYASIKQPFRLELLFITYLCAGETLGKYSIMHHLSMC